MPIEFPYTSRPEDLARLLQVLTQAEVPACAVDADYFKSLGFCATSAKQFPDILKKLGFVDDAGLPAAIWHDYISADKKGQVLAQAVKTVYADLFKESLSPYLEDDEFLLEFLKQNVQASPKDIEMMLQTFRILVEPADFQDLLTIDDPNEKALQPSEVTSLPNVRVDPNLQVSIQVHIDPATPDDKIETIFKNMRKYLLGKTD
jgi:hypothetical protein